MAAPDVPDYTRAIQLFAKDPDGELAPVLVDANGQLYIVIQGELEGITGSITVDQSDSVREVQGDGAAGLKTLAVDSEGRLIMVPRGESGHYMYVDSHGYLATILLGTDSTPLLRSVLVDSSGRIIMVPRGESGYYMDVDASGYLTTILKGEYAETTLKTCAVDDKGRMLMIPTDPLDIWGNAISMGNAELAAIFSGAKRFDRRGNVIKYDDFEHGLMGWVLIKGGGGEYPLLSSITSRTGGFSVKLEVPGQAQDESTMDFYIPYHHLVNAGLEVSFAFLDERPEYLAIRLSYYDGGDEIYAEARVRPATAVVKYVDSAGAEQDLFTSVLFLEKIGTFNTLKMVIDLSTEKWVRALLNQETTPITADLETSVAIGPKCLRLRVKLEGDGSNPTSVYVDDVVLTINEPA